MDGGETTTEIFYSTEVMVTDVHEMKSEKQFVNTLLDTIMKRGAMIKLITNGAKVETSNKVNDVLGNLIINTW